MKKLAKVSTLAITLAAAAAANAQTGSGAGKYASVNGLKVYYEVHGTGQPLILLHGAFGTVEGWAPILPALTKNRQVITVELQGHGHTGDIDRPLSIEQMAEDTAALLKLLKIEKADVFGYSMGGSVAYGLAIKHPELVRKLVVLGQGTGTMKDTYNAEAYQQFKAIVPEEFNFAMLKDPYTKVAPDPSKWTTLVKKVLQMEHDFKGFTAQEVKTIKAPTLLIVGDRDGVRAEHAVEVYRTIPNAQLAIYPNADHFLLFVSPDKVVSALTAFLDAPAN